MPSPADVARPRDGHAVIAAALLLLAGQAAAAPPPSPPPPSSERFSILWEPCPQPASSKEVVVCARNGPTRLPLPAERGPPDRPMSSNPDVSGTGALAASVTPCAARVGGCDVGVDLFGAATSVVRLAQKVVSPGSCCEEPGEATNPGLLARDAVHAARIAFHGKPVHADRVAIDLDAPPPPLEGHVHP